ncbi:MAG: CvpA family protein [bacterium]|nr:CvpA family protein [bacterium]
MVDAIIIIGLIGYVLSHVQEGFFALSRRLVSFIGSAVLAFLSYSVVSGLLVDLVAISPGVADALGFLTVFITFQIVLTFLLTKLFSLFPGFVHRSSTSQIFATIPALVDGLIIASLSLLLLVAVPIFPGVKDPIEDSRLGSTLVNQASSIEGYIDRIFGQATQETLGFLTVNPEEGSSVTLPFSPDKLSINEVAEERMLDLVNEERVKVGAPPLVVDSTIVAVAREHSEDMWERSYFAHENPDGDDPFDRMLDGGVRFRSAGENLALARTVERAHAGLMNSPGHKRNILDPTFRRIGIGAIDGGIYGTMFTQNFAD